MKKAAKPKAKPKAKKPLKDLKTKSSVKGGVGKKGSPGAVY
jgi:hypothetical protein